MTATVTQVDSATQGLLEGFGAVFKSIQGLPIPEMRTALKRLALDSAAAVEPVGRVIDETADGPNGDIPLRIYVPYSTGPLPTLVFFHHGGWAFGSIEESDGLCRKIANHTQSIVVSVGYRLAPEHPFPAPVQDCVAATRWVVRHVQEFGGDPQLIGVAGESAGGGLATAVAQEFRDQGNAGLAFQALFYPILTCELDERNYEDSPDQHLLTLDNMRWFVSNYLGESGNATDASPLTGSCTGLPRTLLLSAEWDPLRHEAAAYAQALRKSKVPVNHRCHPEVIHGYLGFPIYPDAIEQALRELKALMHEG